MECGFTGKPALAAGWLTKARRHLAGVPECAEQGFLAFSDAETAAGAGDLDEVHRLASGMIALGARCASADVVAMGRLLEGRCLISSGAVPDGLSRLDEMMCDVLDGALSDLVTGWLYCLAVPQCLHLAELRRAGEWNEAALRWCAALPTETTPFDGLCRSHQVELLLLRGAWRDAAVEGDRARRELLDYHPRMAASAFYTLGELHRRTGDPAAAEEAFGRAHELGCDPQPGLALLRCDQGSPAAAAAALAARLAGEEHGPLERAWLRAAQVEADLALGDRDSACRAHDDLDELASSCGATVIEALAATAGGATGLAAGDAPGAIGQLRRALRLWLELGPPYEAARTRVLLGRAYQAAGDHDTAHLELRSAIRVFVELGAEPELRRAAELLGTPVELLRASPELPGGLTSRQVQVLRLLAAGRTNRAIAAELVISEHTVARHRDNIYARLGISSRAAATSFAHTHDLL